MMFNHEKITSRKAMNEHEIEEKSFIVDDNVKKIYIFIYLGNLSFIIKPIRINVE